MKSRDNRTANYQGLEVEVISEMEHCSLIRYRNREFVVDTQDLEARSLNVFAKLEALQGNASVLRRLAVSSIPNTFFAFNQAMYQAA